MYTYIYAVGRYKGYQPGFHVVDIAQLAVGDLEKLFSVLYITVNDSMFKTEFAITLDDYRSSFSKTPTVTIQDWLVAQGNAVLKASPIKPGKEKKYAKLERLFTYGYFHYPADLNLAKDRQQDLDVEMAPDIRVEHYRYTGGIDYNNQVAKSLFTVNGVFYRAVGRSDGIYILGAGNDFIKLRKDVRIGAINFQKLGDIKTIPLTKEMLFSVPTNGTARWKVNLPGQDLKNKTVWVVINGQLLVDEEMVYQVGEFDVMINPGGFDPVGHYQTYREYTATPKLLYFTKLDKYKEEALSMHNSFLVIIDNPTLGVEQVPMTTFHYPNVLHTEERFQHPIVLDNGLFPVPYMKSYGRKQRLLSHDVRLTKHYPIQTTGNLNGSSYNGMEINQGDPGHLPKGWLFKIFGVTFQGG